MLTSRNSRSAIGGESELQSSNLQIPDTDTSRGWVASRPPRFRLRVGDWRVFFRRETGAIHVHRVLHRREAYRKSSWIGHEIPVEEGVRELRTCEGLPRPEDCESMRIAGPPEAQ